MSSLKAGKYACYEFERKFLLNKLPDSLKSSMDFKEIEDRYFIGTNLRLRTIKTFDGNLVEYKLTKKFVPEGAGLSKNIITNLYLSESEFRLLHYIKGKTIKKNRYKLKHGEFNFSIDEFKEFHAGLIIAEIEFDDQLSMNKFEQPFADWTEVSLDLKYSGGYLASFAEIN